MIYLFIKDSAEILFILSIISLEDLFVSLI